MKLYSTYSNNQKIMIFRVCIRELNLIRWENEPLQITRNHPDIWEHFRIPKETIMPKNWILR